MKSIPVLLVEDNQDFGNILKQYLEVNNYKVTWVENGKEALNLLKKKENYFSIAILDVMMPMLDGFQLAIKLIEIKPELPFLFLTARKMKEDKIKGLKLGAEDYIIKPFDVDILVLKLNNIFKRNNENKRSFNFKTKIEIKSYTLDVENYLLYRKDSTQKITLKEAELITYLFENKNRLLKREDILNHVWKSNDFFSGRSMDVFISRLRKYFIDDSNISIQSTRGIGLTFKITNN